MRAIRDASSTVRKSGGAGEFGFFVDLLTTVHASQIDFRHVPSSGNDYITLEKY